MNQETDGILVNGISAAADGEVAVARRLLWRHNSVHDLHESQRPEYKYMQ